MKKNTTLIILDGFGISNKKKGNAIYHAKTPFLDSLLNSNLRSTLKTSGEAVGLPRLQMGNSEVGHLNIGGGRKVMQDLPRINDSIKVGSFHKNKVLLSAFNNVKKNNSSLHLIGLLSDGGVHSSINHLFELIKAGEMNRIKKIYVHCILDGRDVSPTSGRSYIKKLESFLSKYEGAKIATVIGRFYSMDRDSRWERIKKGYDLYVQGEGERYGGDLKKYYDLNITDEFMSPLIVNENCMVKDHDSIIFFNFRADRMREIVHAFTDKTWTHFKRKKLNNIYVACMTEYDKELKNVNIVFPPLKIKNTLGEYLSKLKLKQLRIAETEKYAHVTFFFNGGIEKPFMFEDRVLIPSPKISTYDKKPEMSAKKVTSEVLKNIKKKYYDFIVINFANPDMVGHTGNFDAGVKALETLDVCLKKIILELQKNNCNIVVTSDHGNIEEMLSSEGVKTSHSLNDVPLIVLSSDSYKIRKTGALKDIAPTILKLMGLKKPAEMTGSSLLR